MNKITNRLDQDNLDSFHQPRGYNSNDNTNYKPRFTQYNKPRNNFNQYRNPDTRYAYRPTTKMGNNYQPAFQTQNT